MCRPAPARRPRLRPCPLPLESSTTPPRRRLPVLARCELTSRPTFSPDMSGIVLSTELVIFAPLPSERNLPTVDEMPPTAKLGRTTPEGPRRDPLCTTVLWYISHVKQRDVIGRINALLD